MAPSASPIQKLVCTEEGQGNPVRGRDDRCLRDSNRCQHQADSTFIHIQRSLIV